MRPYLLASCLLLTSIAFASSQPASTWGEPEIIGAAPADREMLRRVIDVTPGEPGPALSELAEELKERCGKAIALIEDRKGLAVNCSAVHFPPARVHFVLDVYPADQRVSSAGNVEGIDRPVSFDADFTLTMTCASSCRAPDDRAAAFKYYQTLPVHEELCRSALLGLSDSSVMARNYAAQFLNANYPSCSEILALGDLFGALGDLIIKPNHTDRNKGLATIQMVIQDSRFRPSCDWEMVIKQIARLSSESALPNVGGRAKKILEYINDRPDLSVLAANNCTAPY